jgi:hypothetical protein
LFTVAEVNFLVRRIFGAIAFGVVPTAWPSKTASSVEVNSHGRSSRKLHRATNAAMGNPAINSTTATVNAIHTTSDHSLGSLTRSPQHRERHEGNPLSG